MAECPSRRWGPGATRSNVRSGCPFFSVVDVEAVILEVLEFFLVLEDERNVLDSHLLSATVFIIYSVECNCP